ncbi:unnamed protein product [Schistosoma curassoni]|nr:unnamed protein product [Schistosoma curassoni]
MRTTVESDCCLVSVISVDKTAITSNETEILLNSQTDHESCSSVQSSSCCSTTHLSQEYPPPHNSTCHTNLEKSKCKDNVGKSIKFSGVTVYSFARQQGFSSIPDNGWCTLGMAQKHFSVSRLDLRQHRILQKLRRRQQKLFSQKCQFVADISGRGRGKNKIRGKGKRANGLCSRSPGDSCRVPILSPPPPLSPQISYDKVNSVDQTDNAILSSHATPPPPCLSPPSPRRFLHTLDESLVNNNICNSLDSLDTDSEASLDYVPSINSSKRTQNNSREKLMPIHSAARIRLLRSSGVVEIDESERLVCSFIRAMRSRVGCNCGPKNSCIPGQCSCADDGIPCQVDRASFPCSCAANGCRNPNGRNEFSREQVRTHTQHVLARLASDNSVQPVKSPLDMSEAVLSTPNGACSLCLDRSKTMTMSPNSPISLSGNKYSEPVQQLKISLDNQFLSTSCTDVTHIKDYNISPIDITEDNWSDHSPCSKPLKRSRLVSNHNNSADNQAVQNSVVPSLSFSGSPLIIDLTLSPDEESPNNTPKSTRDRNRFTNNEQTPLSKQSVPMYIPKVPLTEFASQDNNYITTSDIPEAPRSCFTTGILNDDSLLDISVINNNDNNINKDSQSVTIIIHRRRSRSADTTGSCDGDNFPMEMRNNHPKNVDSILKHILTVDPVVCDVTKSSSSVKQLSEVPNEFEYAKSNTCWPITSIMNADNKDCLLSKSAPNSPCLQKNDFPYGRISLRRRAIPRTPIITPSRKVLTQSNNRFRKQFNLLSTSRNKSNVSITDNLSTSNLQSCYNGNTSSSSSSSSCCCNSNNNNLITEIPSQPSSSSSAAASASASSSDVKIQSIVY